MPGGCACPGGVRARECPHAPGVCMPEGACVPGGACMPEGGVRARGGGRVCHTHPAPTP